MVSNIFDLVEDRGNETDSLTKINVRLSSLAYSNETQMDEQGYLEIDKPYG